ncbi:MAG: hypothetical protein EOP06_12820 [Proteobacteria bacterium]|nr:MAG: hypothetical protein EOP06_12820 [Pseudomonadota bacterium]
MLSFIQTNIIQRANLPSIVRQLIQPTVSDLLIISIAKQTITGVENIWMLKETNEYGALLMSNECHAIHSLFAPMTSTGSIRFVFGKSQQLCQLVQCENVLDVNNLAFLVPELTHQEIVQLLKNRWREEALQDFSSSVNWEHIAKKS